MVALVENALDLDVYHQVAAATSVLLVWNDHYLASTPHHVVKDRPSKDSVE